MSSNNPKVLIFNHERVSDGCHVECKKLNTAYPLYECITRCPVSHTRLNERNRRLLETLL